MSDFGLSLTQKQQLQQKLSPQQIQTIKLLELPMLQLEQRIMQEIEDNPMLEEVESQDKEGDNKAISVEELAKREEESVPFYRAEITNRSKDDRMRDVIIASRSDSLQDYLLEQLRYRDLPPQQSDIADYLVGNIDDDGYLRRSEQTLADDMAFIYGLEVTVSQIEAGIDTIQSLDPAGVGARDLRECLILQLDRQTNHNPIRALTRRILASYFEDFSQRRFDKLMHTLGISKSELQEVFEEIKHLSPKPGSGYVGSVGESVQYIMPDFIVELQDGEFTIRLNQRGMPELKISTNYGDEITRLSKRADMTQKQRNEAKQFIHTKAELAQWFINALQQRQQTLMTTMKALVEYQRKYFASGDERDLRPMVLKDIADLTDFDISTVSRVVNSKYVQTNFGLFSLKQLFSEAVSTDLGDEVSAIEVRRILREAIENEDKRAPLNDEELMKLLNEKSGYHIARRTVAKYRETLGIPVARLRREL